MTLVGRPVLRAEHPDKTAHRANHLAVAADEGVEVDLAAVDLAAVDSAAVDSAVIIPPQ